MAAPLLVLVLFVALSGYHAADMTTTIEPQQELLQPAASNNGLYGVASVAGIASRNGRISTLGGVQIYPGMDHIAVTNNGANFFYPATNNPNDRYSTGSIELYPGSVIVSSTARSDFGQDFKPFTFNGNGYKPSRKEVFHEPLQEFYEKARNFELVEPWFLKNVFSFAPPKPSGLDSWMYPNFNPFFNFWQ